MPKSFRTHVADRAQQQDKQWHLLDATDQTLGRLASRIAGILSGKRRADFSPNLDMGDFVVVINAERISVTGRKREQKVYYRHSGYPGGLREKTLQAQLDEHPDRVLRLAVKGMLPRNKIGRRSLRRLHVYAGSQHPHAAQLNSSNEKD
ncbi:MAG: 50S ribosomal protein L13 [Chloroflexi bacterium]|nr:50S ribosomal protein L13 [Chloroflexota bacterium]